MKKLGLGGGWGESRSTQLEEAPSSEPSHGRSAPACPASLMHTSDTCSHSRGSKASFPKLELSFRAGAGDAEEKEGRSPSPWAPFLWGRHE